MTNNKTVDDTAHSRHNGRKKKAADDTRNTLIVISGSESYFSLICLIILELFIVLPVCASYLYYHMYSYK